MRINIINIYRRALPFIAVSFFVSPGCRKFVTIPAAPTLITSNQVFTDSADVSSLVLGMYVSMAGSSANTFSPVGAGITIYTGLASDEITPTSSYSVSDESEIYANAIHPPNNANYSLWANSYSECIYKANVIIEGLGKSQTISKDVKNQFIGEAKFVRALSYFNLVNLYGDVPLVTTTNYELNAVLRRTSTDSVYTQIIADLKDAVNLLPSNYITEGRQRANKYAATSLLSKVYLYRSQWKDAAAFSTLVINAGFYNIESDLNKVFLSGSVEAILQLQPVTPGYETALGYYFVPADNTVIPKYAINSYLLSAFETNDQRRISWVDSNVVEGVAYYYPFKYKLGRDNNTSPIENIMLFRLTEQYLIRAEAYAQDPTMLNKAIDDLNLCRSRAQLPDYPGPIVKDSILAAIWHEDQIEFFCEGHRWFDLKRTGKINNVLGNPGNVCRNKGGTWNANWANFPIALPELQTNPFLKQNPGY